MKLNIIGGLAVSALLIATPLSIANAADMPVKAPPMAPAPVFSWTGFYLGVNAGWIGSNNSNLPVTGTDTGAGGLGSILALGFIPNSFNVRPNGFIGGGQIGYNWQTGIVVYGLEADIDGVSAKATQTGRGSNAVVTPNYSTTASRELDWLATVRGRLGVTPGNPNLLLFVTGGFAAGQTKLSFSATDLIDPNPPFNAASTNTQTRTGYTIGAGAEWAIAPHWSVKAEYLYVNLGNDNATIAYAYGANTSSLTVHNTERYNIARGGLNYRF